MNTDALEHMGNIEVKNDDNYWHGYGLSTIAMYSQKFWTMDREPFQFRDKNLNLVGTVALNRSAYSARRRTVFSPSANRVVTKSFGVSNSDTVMHIIDVKNAELITEIHFNSLSGDVNMDIDKQGNIYVYEASKMLFSKYDKNGLLLSESGVGVNIPQGGGIMLLNSKRKAMWIATNNGGGLFDIDLNYKTPLALSAYAYNNTNEFISGDRLLNNIGYMFQVIEIDYSSDPYSILSTTPLNLRETGDSSWISYFLREINGKLYFTSELGTQTYLYEVDESYNITGRRILIAGASSAKVLDIDNKYVYVSSTNALTILNLNDLSVEVTVPQSVMFGHGGLTRGREINFPNYRY